MEDSPLLDAAQLRYRNNNNIANSISSNNNNNNNNSTGIELENTNMNSSSSNNSTNSSNIHDSSSLLLNNSNSNKELGLDVESQQPSLTYQSNFVVNLSDSNNNNNRNTITNNNISNDKWKDYSMSQSLANLYTFASSKNKPHQQILIISEERDALYSYTFDELQNFLVMLNLKNLMEEEDEEEAEKRKEKEKEKEKKHSDIDADMQPPPNLDVDTPTLTPTTTPTTVNTSTTTPTSSATNTSHVPLVSSPLSSSIHTVDDSESSDDENASIREMMDGFSKKRLPSHVLKSLQSPCWIDLQGLSDEQIEIVGEELSLHPLTVEQILGNDSSEKCEEFPDYLFIICSELAYSDCAELVENFFYIVLFRNYVVVFHREPLDCFDNVIKSFRYLGTERSRLSSSEWLLFAFFDSINEEYTSHSDRLSTEVEILDTFSFQENIEYGEVNLRLGRASRKCTHLLLCLFIKNDILSSLLRENISQETEMYLNNVKDKIIRLKQNVKLTEDLLENLKNVFISKLSLIMNEESHSLNRSMQKFTSLGLIFMPMNLIAGVFGMNMLFPGQVEVNQEFLPFILIIVSLVVIGVISLLLFRKYKLL